MNHRHLVRTAVLALTCSAALAQQPPAASRERELLRRSQAALQEATAQRDAAVAEKAALLKERDGARDEAGRVRTQGARTLTAQREAALTTLQALQAELQQARQRLEAQTAAAAQSETAARQQVAGLRREMAERTQANTQLVAMLEKATTARAAAEQRNRDLHAMGLLLIERWKGKGLEDQAAQSERFFGLGAVRIEDSAETLRARVDALRAPMP